MSLLTSIKLVVTVVSPFLYLTDLSRLKIYTIYIQLIITVLNLKYLFFKSFVCKKFIKLTHKFLWVLNSTSNQTWIDFWLPWKWYLLIWSNLTYTKHLSYYPIQKPHSPYKSSNSCIQVVLPETLWALHNLVFVRVQFLLLVARYSCTLPPADRQHHYQIDLYRLFNGLTIFYNFLEHFSREYLEQFNYPIPSVIFGGLRISFKWIIIIWPLSVAAKSSFGESLRSEDNWTYASLQNFKILEYNL